MKESSKRGHIGDDAKKILAFGPDCLLMAVFKSVNSAGENLMVQPQAISNASTGRTLSSSGLYFRHLDSDAVIESEDIGVLTVQEYDEAVHIIRTYKTKTAMYRERANFLKRRNKNNNQEY